MATRPGSRHGRNVSARRAIFQLYLGTGRFAVLWNRYPHLRERSPETASHSVREHHLDVAIVGVVADEVGTDDSLAPDVCIEEVQEHVLGRLNAQREVRHVGELVAAVGRRAGVAEERVAGGAAAGVHEVLAAVDAQPVAVEAEGPKDRRGSGWRMSCASTSWSFIM